MAGLSLSGLPTIRAGTPAAVMDNQIEDEVVKDRFQRLLKMVQTCSAKKASLQTGNTVTVLFEQVNEQNKNLLTGRMENNSVVHVEAQEDMVGTIQQVVLTECHGFYYIGELVKRG